MDFVDGLKGKLPDEEFAVIKRYTEKRNCEAAQVTVTPVSTVEHCIPQSLNPEMPPDVCASLESNEGKMDPELKELEPPSAGTGLETPGQQCPPNEGTWENGRPSLTAICSLAWDRTKGKTSLRQRNTLVREPGQLRHLQHPGTRQLAKKTSNLIPVEKERRHRFGTRL